MPLLEWLDGLAPKPQVKCRVRTQRLAMLGHELRRPEADYLRDGVHELRTSFRGVQHRILYFFHGSVAAVVSHGIVKEKGVPPKEIDRAVERMRKFATDPTKHTFEELWP